MPEARQTDTEEAGKQDIQNEKVRYPSQNVDDQKQVKLKELVLTSPG